MKLRRQIKTGAVFLMLAAVFFIVLSSGCRTKYVATDRGPQAFYQTGFPIHDTSKELERIFRSVKRINVTGHYVVYIFPPESRITERDIGDAETYKQAIETMPYTNSKAGSATIVASTPNQTALITNEHVIDFPDTVISHFKDPSYSGRRSGVRYIEQIAIKSSQINLIYDLPELGPFDILSRDKINDIALIGVHHPDNKITDRAPVLRVRAGDPTKLVWGSFAYILGYPKGYKMVTRAIVSDPNRDRRASFFLDGLFNEGISGGIILAVRGDTGELEWIGMAKGGAASRELILIPPETEIEDIDFLRPYEGNVYVSPVQRIEYGITLSVSMKSIRNFFREHEDELRMKGYSFPRIDTN